jgi:hypothetical protein
MSKYCKTYFENIKWALEWNSVNNQKKLDVFDLQIICDVCQGVLSFPQLFVNNPFNMKMDSKNLTNFDR